MEVREYSNIALDSARRYYRYLLEHKKGIIEYSIKSIDSYIGGDNHRLFAVQLFDDKPIKNSEHVYFQIDGKTYSPYELCIIEILDDGRRLIVEPAKDLEEYLLTLAPSQIKLISDLKFLVQRIGEWYKNHPSAIIPPSNKLLCNIKPSNIIPKGKYSPTFEQSQAINAIFDSPFTYIWGAPGTGKTKFVLSHAIIHCINSICLSENEKVIIMAPTNNAVDQTLFGVLEVLEDQNITQTKVFRLGTPTHAFFQAYPDICEYSRHSQKKQHIQEELAQIKEDLIKKLEQQQKTALLETIENLIARYCELIGENRALLKKLYALDLEKQSLSDSNFKLSANLKSLQNEWDKFTSKKYYFFHTITSKQNQSYDILISSLSARISKSNDEVSANRTEVLRNAESIRFTKERLKEIENATKDLRSEILTHIQGNRPMLDSFAHATRMLGITDPQHILSSFAISKEKILSEFASAHYSNIDESELLSRIEEKEQLLNNYHSNCSTFQSANIIAGTIDTIVGRYELFDNKKILSQIKHVFIDEAAFTPAIKAMIAFSFNAPVTLLGDHMQLPPVCEMPDNPLWEQSAIYCGSLFTDSFSKFCTDFENGSAPDYSLMKKCDLSYTHRFGKNLASVLAKYVYTAAFQGSPESKIEVEVINATRREIFGRKNHNEATAIADYLNKESPDDIAILSPYKAQVSLIKETVSQKYKGSVMTVHASQGKEYDTVILSVTDTTNMYFVTSKTPLGLRVINTAISRVKNKLVIVCDENFWQSQEEELITHIMKLK